MANGIIFPTSVYGTLGDKYGLNVTAYNTSPNTSGFPQGSGLLLGMFGSLFDGSRVRLLKASGGINNNDFVSPATGNGNDYTVVTLPAAVNKFIVGVSDRFGAALVDKDYAWMTTYGNAKGNFDTTLAAGTICSSGSASTGFARAAVMANDLQANVELLASSAGGAGAYACLLR